MAWGAAKPYFLDSNLRVQCTNDRREATPASQRKATSDGPEWDPNTYALAVLVLL